MSDMENTVRPFDLTPDPKVLITLTHTPMQPLDALCELVDNSLDSFRMAKLQGLAIESPFVSIDLPKLSEIESGIGVVRIRDNGPGLTEEMAEKAVKAGFSGNNSYDTLGLFGMGFNISTGKIGSMTRFITARAEEESYLEVPIDLEEINRKRSYQVTVLKKRKDSNFKHGTITEVSRWWPEGNPNRGFIKRLVQYGPNKIREQLGRRYATILRQKRIRILVNGTECTPFEHCVWDAKRFVEKRGRGKIPARYEFDEIVGSHRRCYKCTALIENNESVCPFCGSSDIKTVQERIKGWVGIQRFDSRTEFGIDLIRNGRAIRIGEKSAFFDYTDEFGKTEKDYPIDTAFGRIVGEVELNHVPVDFMKQDFQRSSPEWQNAMLFLRGASSLQPTKPGADQNKSPIFMLYQGYRKVNSAGKDDMYMGYWDENKKKAVRISRDVEQEYYQKFLCHVPGYYDDTEWYKKVEEATIKPVEALKTCPECGAQHLDEIEVCTICGYVFRGKICINPECGKRIAYSAKDCPFCGKSQVPTIEEQWVCEICGTKNQALKDVCEGCGSPKGTRNRLDENYLIENSNKDDSLSIDSCAIGLPDGTSSTPLHVVVYVTESHIVPNLTDEEIPIFTVKDSFEQMTIFIDKGHPIFKVGGMTPEAAVAYEIAPMIFDLNRRLLNYNGLFSVSNIAADIMEKYWLDSIDESGGKLSQDIKECFDSIKEKLIISVGPDARLLYSDMNSDQTKKMVDQMISLGADISKLGELIDNGRFIQYVDPDTLGSFFDLMPQAFFDGKVWEVSYSNFADMNDSVKDYAQQRIVQSYKSCLNDVIQYTNYQYKDDISVSRARLSLQYLQNKMVK